VVEETELGAEEVARGLEVEERDEDTEAVDAEDHTGPPCVREHNPCPYDVASLHRRSLSLSLSLFVTKPLSKTLTPNSTKIDLIFELDFFFFWGLNLFPVIECT
jgi:hypothetical protein